MKTEFNKVILLGNKTPPWTERGYKVFCRIEYQSKDRLSVVGVEGPLPSGNARGGCGQIYGHILNEGKFVPAEGWTMNGVRKFIKMWKRWHLNDMNAYCEHQRELGWEEISRKEITFYIWHLKTDVILEQNRIKKDVMAGLVRGETVRLAEDAQFILNLDYEAKTLEPELPDRLVLWYEPRRNSRGDLHATEKKTLNWLYPHEHPDGLLTKECPVCGYQAGTKWLHEELPEDVWEYFHSLPDSPVKPAWV